MAARCDVVVRQLQLVAVDDKIRMTMQLAPNPAAISFTIGLPTWMRYFEERVFRIARNVWVLERNSA